MALTAAGPQFMLLNGKRYTFTAAQVLIDDFLAVSLDCYEWPELFVIAELKKWLKKTNIR